MLLPESPDLISHSSSESEMEQEQVSLRLFFRKFIYFIFVQFHVSFYFPLTKLMSGFVKNKLQLREKNSLLFFRRSHSVDFRPKVE